MGIRAARAVATSAWLIAAPGCGSEPGSGGDPGGGESATEAVTPGGSREMPDVLLISLDTVRADFLTFRDPETAPHLSALAERGTVFTQAIAGSSWTLPTHVQMFTGMPPALHGVDANDRRIDPLMPILPALLDDAGYHTAGIFTADYLWGDYGYERGFDFYASAMFEGDVAKRELRFSPRGYDASVRVRAGNSRDYVTSPHVGRLARRALERARPNEPLLLFTHLFDAHADYIPPPPWDTKFDPDYEGDIDGENFMRNRRIYDPRQDPPRRIGDRDLAHVKSLYRGEIASCDQWVGELLAMLDELGRLDRTLVIVTSDHGEEFFEHGDRGHRKTLHDEVLRVPLLIVPPKGQSAGLVAEVASQVSLSDLLPTILDFTGMETPEGVTGRSLRPAMYGAELDPRPELATLYRFWKSPTSGNAYVHLLEHAWRTPSEKLIHTKLMEPNHAPKTVIRYYDLAADPGEQDPITDPEDPRFAAAKRALAAEVERVRQRWEGLAHSPPDAQLTDVFLSLHESLYELGYVERAEVDDLMPTKQRAWKLGPPPPIE